MYLNESVEEIPKFLAAGGVTELPQGFGFDLANSLPGDVELLADLLQGVGLAIGEAEAHPQDLLLPGGQGGEHLLQLFPQKGIAGGLGGLGRLLVLDKVAQMAVLLLADRGLQRDRLLGDFQNLLHLGQLHVHLRGDFLGGVHLRYGGTGTQRVVSDLRELFPKARILRMDNDTVSGKDGHYKILSSFGRREADILVGTQMIAKGHDFPSVTLVGILDADMSLHFSDYRSGERTFQLITQVAGRSGRADEKGKVVLQTYSPENYILRYAVNYDYKGFFENEVKIRRATGFPPYSLICRVMVTAEEDRAALEVLKEVYFAIDALKQSDEDEFIFFNKMHSPIKKIQGKVRYQVLMRLKSGKLLPCIYDIAVRSSTADALAYVEENPANLS